jgi:hypothetical protein
MTCGLCLQTPTATIISHPETGAIPDRAHARAAALVDCQNLGYIVRQIFNAKAASPDRKVRRERRT